MTSIVAVLLPMSTEDSAATGTTRVAAQSRRAREAVRSSAQRAQAEIGALEKDAEDAPLPSNGWHWSLAHTRAWTAGIVARDPVGIDVEPIEARSSKVVPRVTSREELELLGGFSWENFARVWTAKEAVLKKARVGILELSGCRLVAVPGRDSLVLSHRDRTHLVHQSVRDHHIASLAHDGAHAIEVLWHWELAS